MSNDEDEEQVNPGMRRGVGSEGRAGSGVLYGWTRSERMHLIRSRRDCQTKINTVIPLEMNRVRWKGSCIHYRRVYTI